MKIQDIVFLLILAVLICIKNPRISAGVGLASLLISIPIFYSLQHLFTAQRLTYYAAAFFLLSIVLHSIAFKNKTI